MTPRYNIQDLKSESARLEFWNKLESQLILLNINQNTIEESNNVIASSLAKDREIIPRIPIRKMMLAWDDNFELKRLIQEVNSSGIK